MGKELYVGNLSYEVTEYDLEKLFSVSGRVTSIHLITDPKTGQFKGCGYVRMLTEAETKDALQLDGALLIDRPITVSIAIPQKQKPQAGGYKGKPRSAGPGGGKPSGGKSHGAGPSKPAAPKAGFKPGSGKSAPRKSGK